jgi:DNA-binding HxlR family transcriptional regulator
MESLPPDRCSVGRALQVVGDRWSMLVLREAFHGVRRFDVFQRNLGIARNILAARLQTLVGVGILERHRYQERPERFEYRLTRMGADLWPVLVALMEWGDRYTAGEAGAPVEIVHKGCGHTIVPRMTCPDCGEALTAYDVVARPGPGADAGQVDPAAA